MLILPVKEEEAFGCREILVTSQRQRQWKEHLECVTLLSFHAVTCLFKHPSSSVSHDFIYHLSLLSLPVLLFRFFLNVVGMPFISARLSHWFRQSLKNTNVSFSRQQRRLFIACINKLHKCLMFCTKWLPQMRRWTLPKWGKVSATKDHESIPRVEVTSNSLK